MGENSNIEWCDHTFNPWIGCTKVSPGCANCYAETLMDKRWGRVQWGKGNPRQRTSPSNWEKPLIWNRVNSADVQAIPGGVAPATPRFVFCASLADWLDDEVPAVWRADLLSLIRNTPNLVWLLLTKRPENFDPLVSDMAQFRNVGSDQFNWELAWLSGHPPQNVWFGISAEDQTRYDQRMAVAARIPATKHFVSAEPLLGPFVLKDFGKLPDWVIVGGESGPGAREMDLTWPGYLRDQCEERGIIFHFKQWGGVNKKAAGRELDGRIYDNRPL